MIEQRKICILNGFIEDFDIDGNLYSGNNKKNKKWPKNVKINDVKA